jgi:hypothetical protein
VSGTAPFRSSPACARHDRGPSVGTAVGMGVAVLVAVGMGEGAAVVAVCMGGAEHAERPRARAGIKIRRRVDMNALSVRGDNAPHYTRGL